ncbi:MAG: HAD-IIIC family phosphatase [Magnetococcus sp. WYHC-3]
MLDLAAWLNGSAGAVSDPQLWYAAKLAYTPVVLRSAARRIHGALDALCGRHAKLVVVDLDQTLWGGIVGEVGPLGVTLGGHDPVGEAYVAFQRRLKALARRGVLLAIASKNDATTALACIDTHPEMVLRRDDFVAWRIDWNDKAANIDDLTRELNLGLEAVVFIDDNPHERQRVAEALPRVRVPDWPTNPLLYASALDALTWFEHTAITAEDVRRGEMYQQEARREALARESTSLDDWLRSLDMVVDIAPVTDHNRTRVVQLLNKTNQMNLRTRRMTESALLDWLARPGCRMWTFRVRDRIGDLGLCGVLGLEWGDGAVHATDFVLSCRAFKRGVETLMLWRAAQEARLVQGSRLVLDYLPTERNQPCLEILRASVLQEEPTYRFVLPGTATLSAPEHIRVVES